MIRAFIALPLPPEIRTPLIGLQSAIPAGRATDPDNLHLTLAFLGPQPEPLLEEIHLGLESLAVPAPSLAVTGLDAFGTWPPRLLYAAVQADPALTALRRKVRGVVRDAGLTLPHERFVPHVTLARFARDLTPDDSARLDTFLAARAGLRLPPVPATRLALYRSTLRADGAVHDVLADYPLG